MYLFCISFFFTNIPIFFYFFFTKIPIFPTILKTLCQGTTKINLEISKRGPRSVPSLLTRHAHNRNFKRDTHLWRRQIQICYIGITAIFHDRLSLQNKIWNLPDRSTILPKFLYDKEGKLAGWTQILPVRVCSLALILKTADSFIS